VTGENLDKKHCVRTAMGNGLRPDVGDRLKECFGVEVSATTRPERDHTLTGIQDYS
jgi:hypothetical protein